MAVSDSVSTSVANASAGLVSIGKVSAELGVSIQSLRRLDGRLPSYVLPSGHRRYRVIECLSFLRRNGLAASSETAKEASSTNPPSNRPIPICLVVRVSTSKDSQKTSLVNQKERLLAYVAEQFGGVKTELIWNERIASGLNLSSERVLELIDLILSGKLNNGFLLCCWKDRLCRYGWEIFERLCQLHNVTLRYIDELDKKTESEEISQDLLAVITSYAAKANGQKVRKLYSVQVNEEQASLIFHLHSQKLGIKAIAKELKRQGKSIDQKTGKELRPHIVYKFLRKHGRIVRRLSKLNGANHDDASLLSNSEGLDSLSRFIRERLLKEETDGGKPVVTPFKQIHAEYAEFCRSLSLLTLPKNTVSTNLKAMGFRLRLRSGYLMVYAAIRPLD